MDGGPKMINFVVDGKLCDGGPDLKGFPNGHFLMESTVGDIGVGVETVVTNHEVVQQGHVYNRSLYVSEMIGNWRAGLD